MSIKISVIQMIYLFYSILQKEQIQSGTLVYYKVSFFCWFNKFNIVQLGVCFGRLCLYTVCLLTSSSPSCLHWNLY